MATKLNLFIDQGTDFSTTIEVADDEGTVIDLSTYTGRSQMRKHYTSTTFNSFVVTGDANGVITVSMNAATSANITGGRYVWDLELVSSGNVVSRIVEGIVTINPEVTR
jgi:hypothetical protein